MLSQGFVKYSKSKLCYWKDSCPSTSSRYHVDIGPLSTYYVDMCLLSKYCVDMCPLSKYCVNICPLSKYCVNMCLHSNHCADGFCWFLAVSLINYPDMYGLIYQPLSRQNNLSHIFHLTKDCIVYGNCITV